MNTKRNAGHCSRSAGGKNTKFYDRHMLTHTPTTMPLHCDSESQRQRILEYLRRVGPLTTIAARTEFDIPHPAGRVQELRGCGHDIVTHWQTVNTGKGYHRVACYVLLAGGANDA